MQRRRRCAAEQSIASVGAKARPGVLVAQVADHHGPSRTLQLEWPAKRARERTWHGACLTEAIATSPPKQRARPAAH
jgi:hypothetical protein